MVGSWGEVEGAIYTIAVQLAHASCRESDELVVRSGAIFETAGSMADPAEVADEQGGIPENEKRDNVIRLAFGGNAAEFERFCRILADFVPPGTIGILRGSAVTGSRWKDQAPFDADGPGTSDLDVTFVGSGCLQYFTPAGFYVPGVHSKPLSDEDPDIAPDLVPLRTQLIEMVRRPVNLQASREIVLSFRGDLLGQPYLTLFTKPEGTLLSEPTLA
jgi:hypothetical protein